MCDFVSTGTTGSNNDYYSNKHQLTPYTTCNCNSHDSMFLTTTRIFPLSSIRPMMNRIKFWKPPLLPVEQQQCRTFAAAAAAAAAWWRGLGVGGGGKSSSKSKNYPSSLTALVTIDVSKKRQYPITIVNDEYRISICSIQGYRKYMEDEFMIHTTTTTAATTTKKNSDDDVSSDGIVGCFDGHGGKAVSRYLRQNLYINLQAALQMIQQTKPPVVITTSTRRNPQQSSASTDDDTTIIIMDGENENVDNDENESTLSDCHLNDEGHPNINLDENNINHLKIDDSYLVSGIPSTTTIIIPPTTTTKNTTSSIMSPSTTTTIPTTFSSTITNNTSIASVDDYVSALEVALDKVDREVLKVKHWRYQGSTAIVCWIHTAIVTTNESSSLEESADTGHGMIQNETEVDDHPKSVDDPPTTNKSKVRTLITANIGDSRAILCRNGVAIALSRDHKPNDPIEYERIRQVGGTVTWDGEVDRMREPIPGMGCYRINGNIALSRVIGDRSFRPVVNSDPDITLITLLPNEDEFIVVATDGLWDVMSSSDTVAFIHALLDNMDQDAIDRDSIATYVVEEALRRGCQDNITVIIVWLK